MTIETKMIPGVKLAEDGVGQLAENGVLRVLLDVGLADRLPVERELLGRVARRS